MKGLQKRVKNVENKKLQDCQKDKNKLKNMQRNLQSKDNKNK